MWLKLVLGFLVLFGCATGLRLWKASADQVVIPDPELHAALHWQVEPLPGPWDPIERSTRFLYQLARQPTPNIEYDLLTPLTKGQLAKLRRFNGYGEIQDLTGLELCTQLEVVYIMQSPITDLSIFGKLPKLTTLVLGDCKLTSLDSLPKLPKLTVLNLTGNPIEDLTPLAGMRQLEFVILTGTKAQDLTPLRGLPLKTLYLNDTPVEDLTPIATLPVLKALHLSKTSCRDLGPLAQAPALANLDLVDSKADLATLGMMDHLVELTVGGPEVHDLEYLRQCPSLEKLTVRETGLLDLSGLRFRPELRELVLDCDATDLTPLQDLRLLSVLRVNCKSTDLAPLKGLPSLTNLDVSTENIESLEFLRDSGLKRLSLRSDNPPPNLEILTTMPRLNKLALGQKWPATDQSGPPKLSEAERAARYPIDLSALKGMSLSGLDLHEVRFDPTELAAIRINELWFWGAYPESQTPLSLGHIDELIVTDLDTTMMDVLTFDSLPGYVLFMDCGFNQLPSGNWSDVEHLSISRCEMPERVRTKIKGLTLQGVYVNMRD